MKNIFLVFLLFPLCIIKTTAGDNADAILGKWMTLERNLVVDVFKSGGEYKARVVWFDDTDDRSQPMKTRRDIKNPQKALRTRKIIGMEIMQGLVYNAGDKEWQGGKIYDSRTGKIWNAKAWINKEGILKVRGYWHFPIFGQTMGMRRM